MRQLGMKPIATLLRTIDRCNRKPIRIGQATPWVGRVECVPALHAGLGLGHGHTDQGTRRGPESVGFADVLTGAVCGRPSIRSAGRASCSA